MRRRSIARMPVLALILAVVLASGSAVEASESTRHRRPRLPKEGVLFGADVEVGSRTGPSKWLAFASFEDMIGRKVALDREGYFWDQSFPSPDDYLSRDLGRILVFDWNTTRMDMSVVKWADIASGRYDADLDAKAAAIDAFGAPAFFVFQHEPETEVGIAGTAKDFVSAYQHVHDRFLADGVTNLSYVVDLMAFTYRSDDADQFYPGSSYVDLLGADGYNWYSCPGRDDPWTSFADVFTDFYRYGVGKSRPMIIVEYGSMEDPNISNRKARWIADAESTLKSWPAIKAISYFHHGQPAAHCDWYVDTSQPALNAFKAMGADPYFKPPQPPPPSSPMSSYVGVWDNDYGSAVGYPTQGKGVSWLFYGPSKHTVTDNSGMGLFDSGQKAAGSSFSFNFVAAGSYNVHCTIKSGMMATIRVPLVISPLSGNLDTTFRVTWADASPPAGYVYDVQVKRPGSAQWETWKDGVTSDDGPFKADAGRGTYTFHSRIRNLSNGNSSWYSMDLSIVVN